MSESSKVRLVRCPKCDNLLPELIDYSVYQCGGCGAVLRAKHKDNGSGSLSEKSDDEGRAGGDSVKPENLLEKGVVVDSKDTSDVDAKSNNGFSKFNNQRGFEKENNNNNGHERFLNQSNDSTEKGVFENGLDVNGRKDEVGKAVGRQQEESKSYNIIDSERGSKFSGRMSVWQTGERDNNTEGFWRKPRADMEGMRFSTSYYPDEGTSNNYSGVNRVQHLEQDRAELLRKLEELKDQITQSGEVSNNPKEKVRLDSRMNPPDPYGGSDTWFPDVPSGLNRTSRQFFGPDKHMAGPSYFNYHHDPFAYTNSQGLGMPNFHPSMHNPNHIPGYGDPYASHMLRRGPHNLSHQFPQQQLHPHFPGRYVDISPDSYDPYVHNAMLHPPSCSCFQCYETKQRASAPVPPAAYINTRFPNDPMLHRHEIPGAFGPHVHNSRSTIPPMNFRDAQSHTRWPSEINSEMGGFAPSRPRKVMLSGGSRRCHPIAGGSPFITCCNCFELLQLPKKVLVRNHQQKVRCGACSSEISFAVINKKLVISLSGIPSRVDDSANVVASSRVSHSHGANLSSDDYSGYDFHSVDREPASSLPADLSSNSSKPQEMHSFHSSSPSTSEDENSPEVVVAPREVTKSIQRPAKTTSTSLSPPPAGSPLQEYFDYSNNNHAVNRFGKGNRSSRSEQEKVKLDKTTSRQNSLKEAALATEMDVHDYSNTGVSQDSGDASREHDHPRSKKGGESFFANIIKKSFRDFSRSNQTDERISSNVTVNGRPLADRVLKKAEKLAGPIQPGSYWYDFRAGFWGVMGGPCLGIIPPSIEEFNYPMPENCAGGTTGIFVNGRELHQKDLDLLASRGLPLDRDRSYIVEISGRVVDEDTGEELDSLGKLAPTVEKVKHGFGMKVPRSVA
ncbi:protein ENHANCED DISEASE RESISTANCE 4 [Senna tora]|uniref:Protein ENHANCED DISEASE RESISTANCE 4 n=1 Tax=Senna tora TaxID=362788 RepID=A0A834TQJ7_9FABA|nr:protein ENHANCED DISEASE RESISTANCE 4 [Senna tora]